MQYVLTDGNGQVLKYPYNKTLLQRDNKDISFSVINDTVMARYNAFPVREVTPTITETQKIERSSTPVHQDGEWLLVHVAVDKSQAEIDAYLESLRVSARTRLKTERDEIEAEPVNNFQCSRPQDIIKIEKAIANFDSLADSDGKTLWKMADNTYVLVTKADMQALDPLQVMKVAKAYNAEALALQALEQATTQEEIASITVRVIYETL